MKSIYDYSDYREYLRATFIASRAGSPALTIERYAEKLGIGRSTFKMVLSGKRNLTIPQVHRLTVNLKLSALEKNYFETLVLRDRARATTDKAFYARKIKSVKQDARLSSVLLTKRELLSDPYILPILVYLTDFARVTQLAFPLPKETATKVARKFGLEVSQAESALRILLESGVICAAPATGEIHFVFDKLTHIISQKQYVKNWLTIAREKIETEYANEDTYFNAATLSLSRDQFFAMREELKAVQEKYLAMTLDPAQPAMIVQAGIQLFPTLREPTGH